MGASKKLRRVLEGRAATHCKSIDLSRSNGTSALPMTSFVVPMRSALLPTVGNPVIPPALTDPTTWNPHVFVATVLPKSRCPNKAHTRRRHSFHTHRRRCNIDVDGHSGRRNGGCGYRTRRHAQS